MDIKQVRQLIELMKENDLSELKIIDKDTRIFLRRGPEGVQPQYVTAPMPTAMPHAPAPAPAPASAEQPSEPASNLKEIPSPIVGTFYSAPSPNADDYVKIGSTITADSVVCIVEAMKVMNEVKAEIGGTIKKILVENGQPVEFGQPLFLVEPE